MQDPEWYGKGRVFQTETGDEEGAAEPEGTGETSVAAKQWEGSLPGSPKPCPRLFLIRTVWGVAGRAKLREQETILLDAWE